MSKRHEIDLREIIAKTFTPEKVIELKLTRQQAQMFDSPFYYSWCGVCEAYTVKGTISKACTVHKYARDRERLKSPAAREARHRYEQQTRRKVETALRNAVLTVLTRYLRTGTYSTSPLALSRLGIVSGNGKPLIDLLKDSCAKQGLDFYDWPNSWRVNHIKDLSDCTEDELKNGFAGHLSNIEARARTLDVRTSALKRPKKDRFKDEKKPEQEIPGKSELDLSRVLHPGANGKGAAQAGN